MKRLFAFALATAILLPATGAQAADVLWRGGFESGGTGEFWGISASGCGSAKAVAGPAHTGKNAGALTICNGDGGVRMRVEGLVPTTSLPNDAYYSTWFSMPNGFTGDDSNIFQYKQEHGTTKEVLFSIQATWVAGSGWDLRLKGKINQTTDVWDGVQRVYGRSGAAGIYAPATGWFHLETRYVWSKTGQGRITTWLNGRLLWDRTGMTTEVAAWPYQDRPRQWTINHYAKGISPLTSTIYIDDAAVALTRQGGTSVTSTSTTTTAAAPVTTTTAVADPKNIHGHPWRTEWWDWK